MSSRSRALAAVTATVAALLLSGCIPEPESSGSGFEDVEVEPLSGGHHWHGGAVTSTAIDGDGVRASILIPGDEAPVECDLQPWTEDEVRDDASASAMEVTVAAPLEDPRDSVTIFYPVRGSDPQMVAQRLDLADCSLGERVDLLEDDLLRDAPGHTADLTPQVIAAGPTTLAVGLQQGRDSMQALVGYAPQDEDLSWVFDSDGEEGQQVDLGRDDGTLAVVGASSGDGHRTVVDPESGQTLAEGDLDAVRLEDDVLLLTPLGSEPPTVQSGQQSTQLERRFLEGSVMSDGADGTVYAGPLCPEGEDDPCSSFAGGTVTWNPIGAVGPDGELRVVLDAQGVEELGFEHFGAADGMLYGSTPDGMQAIDLQGRPVGEPLKDPSTTWFPQGDRLVDGQLWTTWTTGDAVQVEAVLPAGQRPAD